MPHSQAELANALNVFGELLVAEYARPIEDFANAAEWSELDKLQLSRALEILIKEPIADCEPATEAEIGASDTNARRRWDLSDRKIAAPDWEESWQWQLLSDIDNSSKADSGQMMTPSDPRLFILRIRYSHDFFAVLAGHFLKYFCERPNAANMEDLPFVLQQIPGLANAGPAFIAAVVFMISKLGRKGFCDWCEDRC
jgi:hypothetical protein